MSIYVISDNHNMFALVQSSPNIPSSPIVQPPPGVYKSLVMKVWQPVRRKHPQVKQDQDHRSTSKYKLQANLDLELVFPVPMDFIH